MAALDLPPGLLTGVAITVGLFVAAGLVFILFQRLARAVRPQRRRIRGLLTSSVRRAAASSQPGPQPDRPRRKRLERAVPLNAKTIACPNCSAPLQSAGRVECSYCGSTVFVEGAADA
jgi:DNA-directed RNA polymerase subunit RPC12/RpoP